MKINLKKICLCFLFTFACIFAMSDKTYAEDINLEVKPYLNGKVKIGGINPVEVTVESLGKDINGKVNLYIEDEKYEHDINISANNVKSYTFSVPIKKAVKNIKATVTEKDKILKEKGYPVQICDNKTLFVGIFSDNLNNYNWFKNINITPMDIKNAEIIDLKNKNLNLEYIDNLNLIVIDDFNSQGLTNDQQQNLDSWLNNGGIIFVGQGKYGYKNLTGAFENVKDVVTVGKGSIIPIKFDLTDKNNLNQLNNVIVKNINNNFLYNLTQNSNFKDEGIKSEKLKNCANNMLKININIIYFLISVMFIYIIVFLILIFIKRSKAYLWGATILVFSLMVFGVYSIEDISKEKITVATLNTYSGNKTTTKSLFNVYPYKKDLNIQIKDSIAMCQQGTGKYSLDPINKKIIYNPTVETNYLYNVSMNNMEKKIENKLVLDNGRIKGKILNGFPYKLKDCFLIVGDTLVKIGDLDSKESIKLDYTLDHNLKGNGDYEYLSNIEKVVEDKYEKEFLKYYFNLNNVEELNCKLIGFYKGKTNLNVNGKNRKLNGMNMEVLPVNIQFNKKEIELPEGLVQAIVQKESDDKEGNIKEYTFKKDEYIKIYYLIPKNINANKIILNNTFKDGNFSIEMFNYSLNKWEKLNTLAIVDLQNINDNKLLALRIKGNGRLIIPGLSLHGTLN
ncbi:hypothetical protein [Clostridium lundense]|uniref:hypothetical protein n=1 Tax=Clostridium lundense TaxID=319475 RepID=UPI000489F3B4|nr:hypothetical protein [Clostridium lundense]